MALTTQNIRTYSFFHGSVDIGRSSFGWVSHWKRGEKHVFLLTGNSLGDFPPQFSQTKRWRYLRVRVTVDQNKRLRSLNKLRLYCLTVAKLNWRHVGQNLWNVFFWSILVITSPKMGWLLIWWVNKYHTCNWDFNQSRVECCTGVPTRLSWCTDDLRRVKMQLMVALSSDTFGCQVCRWIQYGSFISLHERACHYEMGWSEKKSSTRNRTIACEHFSLFCTVSHYVGIYPTYGYWGISLFWIRCISMDGKHP